MARILAISSHVVRGNVGLAATVPALQSLGHEVWALPTVLLASRPGLGQLSRYELPEADLSGMLAALQADGLLADARCSVHRLFSLAGGGMRGGGCD